MHGEGVAEMLRLGFGVPARVVEVNEVGLSLALCVPVVELVEGASGSLVQLVDPPLASAKVVEERSGCAVDGMVGFPAGSKTLAQQLLKTPPDKRAVARARKSSNPQTPSPAFVLSETWQPHEHRWRA